MSETFGSGNQGDEVRDEVRLDLDEDKLDTWEDVRGDYAVDTDSEVASPAVVEGEDGDSGADQAENNGDDDRVLVEGDRHDDLDVAPDGTSADRAQSEGDG